MNITPLHDTHAIESVSFGVEWQQPLPPAVMGALESVYEAALKKKLPSKKPVQQFAFEFNLESGGKSIQPAQAVGWTFERFAPDGRIERNLMLTPNTLAVTLHTYTRWEDIPQRIGRVRRFQPGTDPHDVDFTVRYTVDGQPHAFVQNVHQEASGWVPRLQELVRREGGA